jgi:hypothetical protein
MFTFNNFEFGRIICILMVVTTIKIQRWINPLFHFTIKIRYFYEGIYNGGVVDYTFY